MMKNLIWVFVLLLATPLAWAQEEEKEETFKLNVDVDLVEVHVNVTDEFDHPIGNLSKSNFRLTDEFADPTGMTDHLYSERLIRLPRTFLSYAPPVSAPALAPLPGEPVIFCCFNNSTCC